MIGEIQTGDHVDVLAGFNVDAGTGPSRPMLRSVMQNALVLKAPVEGQGSRRDRQRHPGGGPAGPRPAGVEVRVRVGERQGLAGPALEGGGAADAAVAW